MGRKLLLLQLISLILSTKSFAYPNFVGFGYQSCLTCHYNPLGGGPLTDYGRGVGASVVSDRVVYSKKTSEDYIAENSGFFYRPPSIDWFRPSLNYRGLYLKNNYGKESEKSDYIHMMLNFNLTLRLGPKEKRDKYIAVGTFGYAPTPAALPNSDEPNWRTREHYFGFRPGQNWGFYAGLMDKAFGIRVADHIAFSRVSTSNTQNDQSHGFLVHYHRPSFEVSLNGFVGNLEQKKETRQKGASVRGEYSFNQTSRAGLSVMSSSSDFLKQYSQAIHLKTQYGKGSSTMIEVGESTKEIIVKKTETKSRYVMMQNHLRLKRGLQALITGEYFVANTERKNKVIRLGPGLQYFPFQGFEFRIDLYNSRIFSERTVSDDTWDLTGQVHLWF